MSTRKPKVYDKGGHYQSLEDPKRCIAEVPLQPGGWHWIQCSRKRGYGEDGLYCKQHAKRYPVKEGSG